MKTEIDRNARRVLILDLDRDYAASLADTLEKRGYGARAAAPEIALHAMRDFDPALVLCDVEPKPGAIANLPALVMTARPDVTCVAMAPRPNFRHAKPFSDDAIAFINKGEDLDAAVAVIETCFKRRETRGQADSAQDAILNARQAIDEANHAKLEFLAKVSHELRTPLNAIIGFSELIMRDVRAKFGNEQHRTYIEDIHASGRHLLAIINDILDFAKAEAGKLVLQESEVDIRDVVHSVKRLIGARAREAGIELHEKIPADLPELWCDERKLKQMLLNLLSNALKFTPSGGRIGIEAMAGPECIVVTVTDTGVGIAEADLPRVLQPFVQVDTTLSRQQEGTGLGLPLVKAMVELHGGSIALESEPAKGTTVRLAFPPERVMHPRGEEEFQPEPRNRARQGAKR
jgi:signal transduction histidine kinase